MRTFIVLSFSLIAAVTIAPKAIGGTILNVGDTLEIRFSTPANVCPPGVCDVLLVYPQESGSFFATGVTAKLFDGPTLLGTYFNLVCCEPTFRSSSSLFQGGSPTVDFAGINSGDIHGIIDLSIATGYLTWPSAPTPELFLGHATTPGIISSGADVQVNSVTISSIPEPSTFAVVLGGLAFLGFRRSRFIPRRS